MNLLTAINLNRFNEFSVINFDKDILKRQTRDIEIKHYYIEVLKKYDSLNYTRGLLDELEATAKVEIERLGGNPLLTKILDELKDWENKETDLE